MLVSLDTTRADHLGFYGNPSIATPALDRLAAESIVLDDLMTVAPTTLAAHTSLFTGNYPHRHGVPRNGFVVPDENVTLAEILKERGFATVGFVASFALASRFGIDQGFTHYDERLDREGGEAGRMQNERDARAVTDAVIGYLERTPLPERLFLFVHYFDPHSPYAAPAPYETMYDPQGRDGLAGWFAASRECTRQPGKTAERERLAAQYEAEVSFMDHHVGRLFDALRSRGVLDDAVLVVTSDHGEELWEHPVCFDHGWTTYQTTMRAVGMIRRPGAADGGRRVTRLASTVDLLPTLLPLLGVPAPAGIDGQPIALHDEAGGADAARYGQASKPWEAVETDPRWINMLKARCVREGPYKFIQTPYTGREELYDLSRDPAEQTNLMEGASPQIATRAGALRHKLEAWAASARPLATHFDESQREETIERLRALGYIE